MSRLILKLFAVFCLLVSLSLSTITYSQQIGDKASAESDMALANLIAWEIQQAVSADSLAQLASLQSDFIDNIDMSKINSDEMKALVDDLLDLLTEKQVSLVYREAYEKLIREFERDISVIKARNTRDFDLITTGLEVGNNFLPNSLIDLKRKTRSLKKRIPLKAILRVGSKVTTPIFVAVSAAEVAMAVSDGFQSALAYSAKITAQLEATKEDIEVQRTTLKGLNKFQKDFLTLSSNLAKHVGNDNLRLSPKQINEFQNILTISNSFQRRLRLLESPISVRNLPHWTFAVANAHLELKASEKAEAVTYDYLKEKPAYYRNSIYRKSSARLLASLTKKKKRLRIAMDVLSQRPILKKDILSVARHAVMTENFELVDELFSLALSYPELQQAAVIEIFSNELSERPQISQAVTNLKLPFNLSALARTSFFGEDDFLTKKDRISISYEDNLFGNEIRISLPKKYLGLDLENLASIDAMSLDQDGNKLNLDVETEVVGDTHVLISTSIPPSADMPSEQKEFSQEIPIQINLPGTYPTVDISFMYNIQKHREAEAKQTEDNGWFSSVKNAGGSVLSGAKSMVTSSEVTEISFDQANICVIDFLCEPLIISEPPEL